MKKITTLLALFVLISINSFSQKAPNRLSYPMVLQFKTDLSAGTTVTLPLAGTVNVTVDWGDGTAVESFTTSGNKDHTYATDGTYTVSIDGSLTAFGASGYPNSAKLIAVTSFGNLGLTSLAYAFNYAINLTQVPAVLPSTVTDVSSIFNSATSFNQDISIWDTSNITNMYGMFAQAYAFNQNIGNWNTANVTDMNSMFSNATAFNHNIGNWNTANVTNMSYMFANASAFNQNIGSWNITKVTDMTGMFQNATLSTTNYDALLTGWASQIVNANVAFHGGNSKYSSSASAARTTLTSAPNSWTITDGGEETTTDATTITTDALKVISVSDNAIQLQGLSGQKCILKLYNLSGKQVATYTDYAEGNLINTNQLTNAVYLINAVSENGKALSTKYIKK